MAQSYLIMTDGRKRKLSPSLFAFPQLVFVLYLTKGQGNLIYPEN